MAASTMNVNLFRASFLNLTRFSSSRQTLNFNSRKFKTIRNYCEKKSIPHDDSRMAAPVLMHRPSKLDKWILVWTKKYPSISEVPETIKRETMITAKDKARVYTSLVMGVFTIFGCLLMVFLGKANARKGDTIAKRNLDWHTQIKEK